MYCGASHSRCARVSLALLSLPLPSRLRFVLESIPSTTFWLLLFSLLDAPHPRVVAFCLPSFYFLLNNNYNNNILCFLVLCTVFGSRSPPEPQGLRTQSSRRALGARGSSPQPLQCSGCQRSQFWGVFPPFLSHFPIELCTGAPAQRALMGMHLRLLPISSKKWYWVPEDFLFFFLIIVINYHYLTLYALCNHFYLILQRIVHENI